MTTLWDSISSRNGLFMYLGATLIRAVLILYGRWQDEHMVVKYTDVDYFVFTDAAQYVTQGLSPYDRETYRYTPLLFVMCCTKLTFFRAYLVTPNIYLFKDFGKILFAITDILIGLMIHSLLLRKNLFGKEDNNHSISNNTVLAYVAVWLYNPIAINVSTRGNSESLIGILVLASLFFIVNHRITLGAFIFGLSVHFKIYPIIFGLPLMFYIQSQEPSKNISFSNIYRDPTWKLRIKFFVISASTFLLLGAFFYSLYGWKFLYETYLYHFVRKDIRHSFSVYFYYLYLTSPAASATLFTKFAGILAFIPQVAVAMIAIPWRYYKDIGFCIFLQTFAFVAFNKVCTVQYFIWYFSLLPLVLPDSQITLQRGAAMFAAWLCSQGLWLYFAYKLEFLGENTFLEIWIAGLIFFAVNIWIIASFIRFHAPKLKKG